MVTATQLSSYLYCPRKLFISNVLPVKEPPKEELVKGKIWHEAHDMLNKSDEKIVSGIRTGDYHEIFDIYRRRYSKILRDAILKSKSALKEFDIKMIDLFKEYWPDFEEEAKERAYNLSIFIDKNKIYGDELWEKLTPKILSEQYFKSTGLNLSGVIDVIEIHDNTVYVPVELKTGKFPDKGMWDGHRVQLAAYMMLLEDSGKTVTEAVLKYRGADRRILQMNSFLKKEVKDLIKKCSVILQGYDAPGYVDNKNKCKSCNFREVCYDSAEMNRLVEDIRAKLSNSK